MLQRYPAAEVQKLQLIVSDVSSYTANLYTLTLTLTLGHRYEFGVA